MSEYSQEADRLKYLSEAVLKHFNKDEVNFSLQVSGEEVKILPKTEVAEEYQDGRAQFHYSLHSSVSSVGQLQPLYDRKHLINYF